jgi:hypothetical protein
VPSLYNAKMGGGLAHTIQKFLGQDLGPGVSAAPFGRDFEQVRSKGIGSGLHSEKQLTGWNPDGDGRKWLRATSENK